MSALPALSRGSRTAQGASPGVAAAAATPHPPAGELHGIVHILTCGSVDDGKSTLIGRLLWDAGTLPEDTRLDVLAAAGADGLPDFSRLVDGLIAEREQGITIDIAWRYFDAGSRRHVIIDSPGHEQYTRNMASGASHADVAIMLVDARHGIKQQTRRHAAILHLVGLKHVILAVNKMDLVDWSEDAFRVIEREFAGLARKAGFECAAAVPVAARSGDNVVGRSTHMPWYGGPTLIELVDRAPGRSETGSAGLRLPVQTILRSADGLRGIAGTISSGQIRIGDPVCDAASGRPAHVKRIVTMDGERQFARAGHAIVVELDRDLDISRGALMADPQTAPRPARRFEARIVWLADAPLQPACGLLLHVATDLVPVQSLKVAARLDLETMDEVPDDRCAPGDVVIATIDLVRPAAVDLFAEHSETGGFVLVDALTGTTLAGGVITSRSHSNHSDDQATPAFMITEDILLRGICRDVAPGSAEFHRRAGEVAILLRAAGVPVAMSAELGRWQDPDVCSHPGGHDARVAAAITRPR